MKRVHLLITGNVQSVGFRWFVQRTARQLEITGWVKNRTDSSVEAVAEGKPDAIKEFINTCRKGPGYSNVENVVVDEEKYEGNFERFEIR
ncbi:MAG: acylphosphatase [Nanoarchaeota archaeon]